MAKKPSTKKRWRKGQSSSSNPDTKNHRDAAKSRFFITNTDHSRSSHNLTEGVSKLTVSALSKHDVQNSQHLGVQENDATTFKTWATNWTDCTNTTFNKVHQNWSNDALHKEVLAVLAAITEIIKQEGGQETEVEYFAILMTTLETTEDAAGLGATIYLLSMVLKKLPRSVIQGKFSDISKVLMSLLEKNADNEGAAFMSKLINCLTTVLRSQDASTWDLDETKQVYRSLLSFSCCSKPKVRKAVREAVVLVLRASEIVREGIVEVHPAAAVTETFCMTQVQHLLNSTLVQKSKDAAQCSDIIHTLQLIKNVIGYLPRSSLKSSCEMVLRLMSLNNLVLKGVCLEVLNSLFYSQPPTDRLSPDLNAKIITAMYDFLPHVNDIQMMPAWLLVIENALINLCRNDAFLCLSHLPRLVSCCLKCFLSERVESRTAAAVTLKSLLVRCVGSIEEEQLHKHSATADGPLMQIIQYLEATLGYQYHASWSLALQVITSLFEVLGMPCRDRLSQILPALSDLRDNTDFAYKAELDRAIGAAVKYLHPNTVLSVIPLEFSVAGEDIRRSWLMPILSKYISHTELDFFRRYFLPLASKCRDVAAKHKAANNAIQQKVYEVLLGQIWDLLPAFCTKPTDLLESFKNVARTIGQVISDNPALRRSCLAGLRKLIYSAKDNEEYTTEMKKYAKNFLPILFNIYTEDVEGESAEHQVVLDTVRDYLEVAEQQLVNSFFDKCVSKLSSDSEVSRSRKYAIMDLAISMTPYVDVERISQVCTFVAPLLEGSDKTMQKKGYRFLDNICSMKTTTCSEFVVEHMDQLQGMLTSNLSTANPSSKAPRLRCLINIFKMLEKENKDFLVAVLPEAMLCTREVAEAARKASYDLLVAMCEANISWNPEMELSEVVMDFMNAMVAGLAGSPQMMHCTILAITRIIFEYKDVLTSDNLVIIMNHCCALLKSKSKEVVTPALSLLKVIVGCFDVTVLSRHLQSICQSISYMKEANRLHLRFKVKEILDRLVRKFGFELVIKLLPESYHKQLANIKKTQDRKKRAAADKHSKKTERSADGEDESLLKSVKKSQPESVDELLQDSDSEIESAPDEAKKSRKKQRAAASLPAWLKDDGDDITDFLDSNAAKNIVASRPTVHKPSNTKKAEEFKTVDGRMVITEQEDEQPKNHQKADGQAELEDIDDIFEQFEMQAGKKSKKRRFESMSESASQISSSTYKSGGRGIHRSLNSKKKKTEPQAHTGAEFSSKKGAGDVKKKNKLDPYAYVPLNASNLNRRKAAKMKGQYKSLVGGARKGASKGAKIKKSGKRR
ncbi:RRP12-like protein [Watersipora subatra]|uniref:RRP12-like protein n=1 Tax=Watersipora subatra TaxID=2589382 RepID=UPI00355C0786